MQKRKECHISRFVILIAIPVWADIGEAGAMERVRLWSTAVVVEEQVTLGDVCDLSRLSDASRSDVASTVVAPAPAGGRSVRVSAQQVQRALRAAGLNPATTLLSGATQVTVRRPAVDGAVDDLDATPAREDDGGDDGDDGNEGGGGRLLEAVREAFELHNANGGGRVDLQFGRLSSRASALSSQACAFKVRPVSGRWLGRMLNVDVDVTCDGGGMETVHVVVSASLMKRVVVAAHAINLKATIGREDVALVVRAFDRHADVATRLESVVGQRAKRFIESGSIVSPRDLEQVPLVKRGELVHVTSAAGAVSVASVGQAKGEGVLGDVVEVQIGGRRGESVLARVVGKGQVQIGDASTVETAGQLALGVNGAY